MTRLANRRNFSVSFLFRITKTGRVASDLLLFFAEINGKEEEMGDGDRGVDC